MAKQQTRHSDVITDWEQTGAAVAANINEVPHLEVPRAKLQTTLEEVRSLLTQQDLHAASKQQVSQRLRILLADGRKLATFLRTGIKEHFGNRNEKLVEFGIQPFRRRKREPIVTKPVPTPEPQGPVTPASKP
jgi:hypothetical protein